MKELIKEAERLYKNIDETQSHLIKARLDKDRIREHLELIGLETIVFDAKQLLKCIIDRKDNIVDLSEVWHDITEEPKLDSWFLGQIGKRSYDTYISAIEGKKMIEWFDGCNIKRWAYIDDLLPKRRRIMEYHEIGERFEYDGVVLEVIEATGCASCFFSDYKICKLKDKPKYCGADTRFDNKSISYKLVEQCKPKDMEQKTEIKIEGTDKTFATQVTNIQSDEEIYGSLLDKLFTTYKAKNHDYSNAFSEMFDELGIDYAYGKLREKINRIKVLRNQPNMVENEGLEDALLDTAGYAILTLVELKKRKQ